MSAVESLAGGSMAPSRLPHLTIARRPLLAVSSSRLIVVAL